MCFFTNNKKGQYKFHNIHVDSLMMFWYVVIAKKMNSNQDRSRQKIVPHRADPLYFNETVITTENTEAIYYYRFR